MTEQSLPGPGEHRDGAERRNQLAPADMRQEPVPRSTPWRYLLYLVGAAMVFIGLKGIIHDDNKFENPIYWSKLFVGAVIVNDLILAPVVAFLGLLALRRVPALYRVPIQLGLFATGVLSLIALPGVRQYNSNKDNKTVNPLNYAHGLTIVLVVVWAVVLATIVVRVLRRRRSES